MKAFLKALFLEYAYIIVYELPLKSIEQLESSIINGCLMSYIQNG